MIMPTEFPAASAAPGPRVPGSPVARPRTVERLVTGQATRDGAGVRLTRLLTSDLQRRLDPFLMLDAFGSDRPGDYIGGFPDHPHRGFETVTLMMEGRMRHRDSAGNEGLLVPGSVQWMTAGRGVIHSEMPEQEDGRMEGYQLWLNLPAREKMRDPWYRDIATEEMPVWQGDGVRARVIAGRCHDVAGAVHRDGTQATYLDLQFDAGAPFELPLPPAHNAFVVVHRGTATVAGTLVPAGRMAILVTRPEADGVTVQAGADGARVLLIAGQPLREPIAQYGPFVMNTREELIQAVEDFQAGRLA